MALPHLKNPKVKATSNFGYLFKNDVESGFFFIKSFKFGNSLMPFFFYYFLSLGNKKKSNGTQTKNFCKNYDPNLQDFKERFSRIAILRRMLKNSRILKLFYFLLVDVEILPNSD